MDRNLPWQSEPDYEAGAPTVLSLDDDAAGRVIDALGSETARTILTELYEEPASASDLAESAGTSIQNVRYHLENLSEAGLVRVVDTWYSQRGREMDVYAATDDAVVLFAGGDPTPSLRALLKRALGGVGVVAIASLLVQRLAASGRTPTPSAIAVRTDRPGDRVGEETRAGTETAEGARAATPETTATPAASTPEPTAARDTPTSTPAEASTPTEALETATPSPTADQTTAEPISTATRTPTPNGTPIETTSPEIPRTATEVLTTESVRAGREFGGVADSPAVVFFLGGCFVVLAWLLWTAIVQPALRGR
jgi:DNA-binding transcriptional ArsR family regulator